jgi:hypothetical protein
VDAGVTPKQAETKYIALVEAKKKEFGYDAKKTTMHNGTAIDSKKQARFAELSKQLGKNQ